MTYGHLPPLPKADTGAGHRHPNIPGRLDVMAVASLLLGYPDDSLDAALPEIKAEVDGLPSSAPASALGKFLAWFTTTSLVERQIEYVRVFDQKRRSALYLTYSKYGDSRDRGAALADLRRRYHQAGFVETGGELPDYLPMMLQFAALVGDQADDIWANARPGLDSIVAALKSHHSPYADVLLAVTQLVPARVDTPEQEGLAA